MSVYIKGMEMPKKCAECPFFVRSDSPKYPFVDCKRIGRLGSVFNAASGIPVDCPLVPVPPHGRLIDADALEMERRAENAKKGWHDSFAVVFNGDPYYEAIYDCTEQFKEKELVGNAPTIIPAEESDE